MNESNTPGGKRLTAKDLGEALLKLRKDGGFDNIFAELADPRASAEELWHGAHTISGALYISLKDKGLVE